MLYRYIKIQHYDVRCLFVKLEQNDMDAHVVQLYYIYKHLDTKGLHTTKTPSPVIFHTSDLWLPGYCQTFGGHGQPTSQ